MTPDIRMRITQLRHGIVPEGYKRTRHGVLPKDWQIHIIEECLEQVSNPVDVEADTMYTQIGIRSHGKGLFYKEAVSGEALGNKSVFWIEPNCFVLNIVFAWEQAIGKTTQAEVGMIGSHRFPMYRPIEGKVDIDYLIYYLLTKRGTDILEAASPGGAGRNRTLGQERFMKSRIPLPPLPDQQKIAAILSAQDKVIELKEKRLAQKQRQKKYLMQQLLTGKKRLDGFEEEWIYTRIGSVCVINPKPENHADKEVAFLGMSDVSDSGQIVKQNLVEYEAVKSGYTAFKRGDVLVAKITPCFENGKGAITDSLLTLYGCGSTEFHVLRCHRMMLNRYLFYHTQSDSFRKRLEAEMVGTAGQKRVQSNSISLYGLWLPGIKEQRAITGILFVADHEISLLQQDIDQEKQKKKALMQLLLMGIVRVKA